MPGSWRAALGLSVELGRCPRAVGTCPSRGLGCSIPRWELVCPALLQSLGVREPQRSPSEGLTILGGDGCTEDIGASWCLGLFWAQHKPRQVRWCPGSIRTEIPLQREKCLGEHSQCLLGALLPAVSSCNLPSFQMSVAGCAEQSREPKIGSAFGFRQSFHPRRQEVTIETGIASRGAYGD